jgi:hypothetical protein
MSVSAKELSSIFVSQDGKNIADILLMINEELKKINKKQSNVGGSNLFNLMSGMNFQGDDDDEDEDDDDDDNYVEEEEEEEEESKIKEVE